MILNTIGCKKITLESYKTMERAIKQKAYSPQQYLYFFIPQFAAFWKGRRRR